ncbi:MAG: hypothetical protein NC043_08260 [Muribaculaceae bacterium]|nr:hypothetical protein [Muribaculaceae bacterium]
MDERSLLNYLASNLSKLDGGATYIGTYGAIPNNGLFTAQVANRPSKSWPKAQFLYTSVRDQGRDLARCISQWKQMCAGYKDQYLIITDVDGTPYLYDFNGTRRALNDEIPPLIDKITGKRKPLDPQDAIDKDYLRAMRAKPFLLLAGISGTGKSRIVKEMAFDSCPNDMALRKDPTSPGNYCLIEVKPNWHDSTELIGYESRIGGDKYIVTPFVKFLVKAMLHEDTPFFVCLDEMNLAPVEQYFAEFLSVLESRKVVDGVITSEPLIKPSVFSKYHPELMCDLFDIGITRIDDDGVKIYEADPTDEQLSVYQKLTDAGLRIPRNLIVIGTVNMDETTHQFSRKVIDRAMTIEMNLPEDDPFMAFYNSDELGYHDEPLEASLFLPTIVSASEALEKLYAVSAENTDWLKRKIADTLTDLNTALDNTPFKVAYRVQNELVLYFYEQWRDEKEPAESDRWQAILANATDRILMMKVLPRVEGDEDMLEKPLEELANFCAPYQNAKSKVEEMKRRFGLGHFTSYWP